MSTAPGGNSSVTVTGRSVSGSSYVSEKWFMRTMGFLQPFGTSILSREHDGRLNRERSREDPDAQMRSVRMRCEEEEKASAGGWHGKGGERGRVGRLVAEAEEFREYCGKRETETKDERPCKQAAENTGAGVGGFQRRLLPIRENQFTSEGRRKNGSWQDFRKSINSEVLCLLGQPPRIGGKEFPTPPGLLWNGT